MTSIDVIARRAAAKSYVPAGLDRQDLEQEARIGLWMVWPQDEALLNTVAQRRVIDAVRRFQPGGRGEYAPKPAVSLETVISEGGDEPITLGMTLTDPTGLDTTDVDVDVALKRLDARSRWVCKALMAGWETQEVAEHLGITTGRVSQLKALIRERLRPWADLQDAA